MLDHSYCQMHNLEQKSPLSHIGLSFAHLYIDIGLLFVHNIHKIAHMQFKWTSSSGFSSKFLFVLIVLICNAKFRKQHFTYVLILQCKEIFADFCRIHNDWIALHAVSMATNIGDFVAVCDSSQFYGTVFLLEIMNSPLYFQSIDNQSPKILYIFVRKQCYQNEYSCPPTYRN